MRMIEIFEKCPKCDGPLRWITRNSQMGVGYIQQECRSGKCLNNPEKMLAYITEDVIFALIDSERRRKIAEEVLHIVANQPTGYVPDVGCEDIYSWREALAMMYAIAEFDLGLSGEASE